MTRPLILVVDDEQFYLDEFALELEKSCRLELFKGPDDFLECPKEVFSAANYIFIDYEFRIDDAITLELAQFARKQGFRGKLILWSLYEEFEPEVQSSIDKNYDYFLCKAGLGVEKFLGSINGR